VATVVRSWSGCGATDRPVSFEIVSPVIAALSFVATGAGVAALSTNGDPP
jgi:hypothetical protein